jgi:hypothetical protein
MPVRVGQHLEIGLKALEKLKAQERGQLHSRKLRSLDEVAFQEKVKWRFQMAREAGIEPALTRFWRPPLYR